VGKPVGASEQKEAAALSATKSTQPQLRPHRIPAASMRTMHKKMMNSLFKDIVA
jgi:hypothetical protein